MTATTAIDRTSGSQVQYYFECVLGDGHSSGWIINSTYVDTGLTSGTPYRYRVKARDAHNNETAWSETGDAVPSADSNPPQPDPMEWETPYGEPNAISSTSIRMVAKTAIDITGVEYYFDCNELVSPGCHDCDWQDSTTYVDSGLDPCTTYTYRVKARDKSTAKNTTEWSAQASATTWPTGPPPPPVDTNAPTPNPSQWAIYPQAAQGLDAKYPLTMWYHRMAAVVATDASPPVMYYFQCIGGGISSGWITSSTYIAGPFLTPNYCAYKVYTKDAVGNVGSPSSIYHILYGEIPP
jgi:chitodextrinase